MFANTLQTLAYKYAVKPIFFRLDPENVHDRVLILGKRLGRYPLGQRLTRFLFDYRDPVLTQEIHGVTFHNPVGLAAGFDKNAELTQILPHVGFGFEEVGSITGEACEGNAKPRLWRHPKKKSLRVFYGLKNDGCEEISARLRSETFKIPIGISVAKTNCEETAETSAAIADYVKAYQHFSEIGSYDTINISCPNAFGGQPFTDPDRLDALLEALNRVRNTKPMFVKLSPDLSRKELRALAKVAAARGVNGLICSNLTKQHMHGKGGLSGKAVADLSLSQLEYLYKKFGDTFIYISCGGIFTAKDAYERICHGASLVQLATGMIYQGPQVIGRINKGIARRIKKDGFANITEAIGSAYRR